MIYHCTLESAQDGLYIASFPDIPSVITFAETKEQALSNAEAALNACLETDVSRGLIPPRPSFKSSRSFPISVTSNIVIAIRLRELRGSDSQSEVAEKLGITYQSYQTLENPIKSNPTLKTLEKVAKALGKKITLSID